MFSKSTPSSVLFADLKNYWKITNKDAAFILLSPKTGAGGRIPRDWVDKPVYLSRNVVNVEPINVDPGLFGSFYSSTQTLYRKVLNSAGGAQALDEVLSHYSGPAAQEMIAALTKYNRNPQLYRNELIRLRQVKLQKNSDRALLLFMLFCITGCLADPAEAVKKVEDFSKSMLAQDLTTVSTASSRGLERSASSSWGLMRRIDKVLRPPFYPLNQTGTVLGGLVSGPNAISDVGHDVSREHALIWFDGNRWLCKDLDSTNGTSIVRASDHSTIEVKPPRNKRRKDADYPPQELHEGDTLQLGSSTSFIVLLEPDLE